MTTANEIFDVVNERDEVVGRETRLEVHKRGLLHRAVHVLIFNASGQLFLQKRSLQKDCFPGTWDSSAAGHLAPGEAYDDCAIREVREELGLELSCAPIRLFKIDACPETGQEFVWVYRHEAEGPFLLDPVEIDRGDWFGPESIDRWIAEAPHEFADAFRLIWQTVRSAGAAFGASQPDSAG